MKTTVWTDRRTGETLRQSWATWATEHAAYVGQFALLAVTLFAWQQRWSRWYVIPLVLGVLILGEIAHYASPLIDEDELLLLADAQTSGGLLVAGELPGHPVVGELIAPEADGPVLRVR